MELNGEILIGATRSKVWVGLNDPEILQACIPGCESMSSTSDAERTAHVLVKIGPVRARFVGHIRREDIRPNHGCLLRFEGSGGAAGMAKGHSQVELLDESHGTRLRYTVNASIGGKLGQVGGRMIDAAAKQMADQFFSAFNAQMMGHAEASAPQPLSKSESLASNSGLEGANSEQPVQKTSSNSEMIRLMWFCMGALATGLGIAVGSIVF